MRVKLMLSNFLIQTQNECVNSRITGNNNEKIQEKEKKANKGTVRVENNNLEIQGCLSEIKQVQKELISQKLGV